MIITSFLKNKFAIQTYHILTSTTINDYHSEYHKNL